MQETIKIIIADDEPQYRSAIERVMRAMAECQIIGICQDGQEALDLCLQEPPDVLLVDVNMPRMNGLELIRKVLRVHKDVRPVVLTVEEADDTIFEAFRSGALGYILKTSTPSELMEAVRSAYIGEARITPSVAARLISDFRRIEEDEEIEETEMYELSDRELEILQLLAQGKRNKEIADELEIAEKTVKNHVSAILKALHVNSRTEAAMKAVKARLVQRG
ncbi:MAG: response regulator [Fimbriimonadaceae bacterium]